MKTEREIGQRTSLLWQKLLLYVIYIAQLDINDILFKEVIGAYEENNYMS
jgi:hypothetical protein